MTIKTKNLILTFAESNEECAKNYNSPCSPDPQQQSGMAFKERRSSNAP